MTDVKTAEITETHRETRLTEPGDHEKMSHYVTKKALEKAIFDGIPTIALCGKKWLPTRDPKSFPVCQECKDIYESMEG